MIQSLTRPVVRNRVVPVLFFALLTAVTARVTIPLPFTPVPITLQVLAVLLSGLVLGSRGGALNQIVYLAAILVGLPLSAAGLGGPAAFVTPTAGYLVAFVPAAFVAGWISERARHWGRVRGLVWEMVASLAGVLVIYGGGVAWLTVVTGSVAVAIQQGALPFMGVDLGKAVVAALVAGGGRLLFGAGEER